MSRICDISGKRANNANRVTFSNKHNAYWQYPNVQTKKFFSAELDRYVKLKVRIARVLRLRERNRRNERYTRQRGRYHPREHGSGNDRAHRPDRSTRQSSNGRNGRDDRLAGRFRTPLLLPSLCRRLHFALPPQPLGPLGPHTFALDAVTLPGLRRRAHGT